MNNIDTMAVNSLRVLCAEGIDKAKSGHPGFALGAAPLAYTLFSEHYKNDPADLNWDNRDRFVLSAGHGSMLLYSLFHVFGYGISMDDIKSFRQTGALTAGHPEYRHTPGVEITTGPLGMGVANAVGMAMAEAHLAAEFNKPGYDIVDHYTYILTGDGCLQEGVSAEASSLAGHLKLGKLILIYDRNQITIEGSTDISFTEDVGARYAAYGWQVLDVADGNTSLSSISEAITEAKKDTSRPTIIISHSAIAYGCPAVQGSQKSHGSPLGAENTALLKKTLGVDANKSFYIPDEVYARAKEATDKAAAAHAQWNALFSRYEQEYPELAAKYKQCFGDVPADIFSEDMYTFEDKPVASRVSSGTMLNRLADKVPALFGGSADLAPSNNSAMKEQGDFQPGSYAGRNIHFGIREFAMGAIGNGMAAHGGVRPYVATFFVFSDYLRHAIRLSAMMQLPVIYIMTHDSIGVGEDGPTHEPIEQLAACRSTPGLYTWRPADSRETAAAYEFALTQKKPTLIALSRQALPQYKNTGKAALKGGYIFRDAPGAKLILIGTGSELSLCEKAADLLAEKGIPTRIVSMPCTELFDEQSVEYKESVLPNALRARLAVEAGSSFGWQKYTGLDGGTVTIDTFGASGPASQLFEKFGFTAQNVAEKAMELL